MDAGKVIRELREARGVSLRALAEASGVNFTTIRHIERGDNSPSVATLEKILDALGASLKIEEGRSE